MPITRVTVVDEDGSGCCGTILNNAWLQAVYESIDQEIGEVRRELGAIREALGIEAGPVPEPIREQVRQRLRGITIRD